MINNQALLSFGETLIDVDVLDGHLLPDGVDIEDAIWARYLARRLHDEAKALFVVGVLSIENAFELAHLPKYRQQDNIPWAISLSLEELQTHLESLRGCHGSTN